MLRYLIDDINGNRNVLEIIKKDFNLTIFDACEMTDKLMRWDGWKNFNPDRTIIILPGNGASIVKKYINNLDEAWLNYWPNKFYPVAKRVWKPRMDPQVFVERVAPERMLLGIKDVMIIDDVVSSGSTVGLLREINLPWIPGANWSALTWIAQKKRKKKSYLKVSAIEDVGTTSVRVPINSLSTLLENSGISDSYANRNFGTRSTDFLELLNLLRQN